MKLGLTANPKKPAAMDLARRVIQRIGDRAELELSEEIRDLSPERAHGPIERLRPDVLIAIGGDGTFLYAMRRTDVPLLPINAGTVGVLAEITANPDDDLASAIDRLVDGHYHIEERMKLAAQLGTSALPDAVNEYVAHAARVGKMGLFEVAFDDEVVGRIQADGIILSTPTGSTGYSLSSLGPIVDPDLDAIVVTTIAPFRIEARALVVDPLRTVRLRAIDIGRGAVVIPDGQEEYPIAPEGSVTVYRSPRRARLVRFGARYFHRLRGKRILPWSEEFADRGGAGANLPPQP
ncbi:MAG TPA: NAD(+)/NADH kinase [Thermoplasmata archaeon]|nr:NAD(+)/NADH kinase [Thermoplasmata archaeon]